MSNNPGGPNFYSKVYYPETYGSVDYGGVKGSSAAIQSAINAAAISGGIVDLSSGTLLIDKQLIHKPNVWIRGQSKSLTTLKSAPNLNTQIIVNNAFSISSGNDANIRVSDLTFDLNGTKQTTDNCPQYSLTTDLLVERISIINPWGYSLLINGVAGAPTSNVRPVARDIFIDCTGEVSATHDGFDFGDVTDGVLDRVILGNAVKTGISSAFAVGLNVVNCIAYNCGAAGISIEGGINVNMVNCVSRNNQVGIQVIPWETASPQQPSQSINIIGCTCVSNSFYGILAQSNTLQSQTQAIIGLNIIGCNLASNVQEAILLQSTYGVVIDGNNMFNNSFGAPGAFPAIRLFTRPDATNALCCSNTSIKNNKFYDTQGTPSQTVAIQIIQFDLLEIIGNSFDQATTPLLVNANAGNGSYTARGNRGFNPLGGAVTGTPTATPVSTTHYQNTTGHDLLVSLTGGTASAVIIYDTNNANGVTIATASGAVFTLPNRAYYSVTWTVQPTAAFYGL